MFIVMSELLLTTSTLHVEIESPARRKTVQPLVLIVEDHPDTRELLKYLIESSGYRVLEAGDGEEAVRLAECLLPNLILMDTSLPHVDGLMATERIRKLKIARKVTIIFLSGHAQPEARAMALAAGGDDYFVKPINFEKLESALEKYLRTPLPTIQAGATKGEPTVPRPV
jgi:CheY-like chemotaxis protein